MSALGGGSPCGREAGQQGGDLVNGQMGGIGRSPYLIQSNPALSYCPWSEKE